MSELLLYDDKLIADYKNLDDIIEDYGYDHPFVYRDLGDMTTKKYNEKLDLSEFLQWGRRNPSRFTEEIFNVQLMDYQRYLIDSSWCVPFCAWAMSRNGGKALSLDTPILTAFGTYKNMGDLSVGDYVIGDDGKPTKIISLSPIFANHQCYKISFDDGEIIVSDAEHIWSVFNKKIGHCKIDNWKLTDITTQNMYNDFVHYRKDNGYPEYKYGVPMCDPIQYPEKDVPINPYILGIWLGDGMKDHGQISSGKEDYSEMIDIINNHSYSVFSVTTDVNNNKRLTIHNENDIPLKTLLRQNNLVGNKFIPEIYFYSSVEQRLELIRGLMDTDGSCDKKNCYFYNTNKNIIDGFIKILDSLGIKNNTTIKHTKCNGKNFDSYVITFSGCKQMPLFYLKRKYDRLPNILRHRRTFKTIINIEKCDTVLTRCICVNNKSHRYLCGLKNTVTHNSIGASLFVMDKMMLIPNFKSYILAGVGSQSIEMFLKMESFALKSISSFTNLNDIFQSNVVKNQANSNGWVHNPASYTVRTYGGAQCFTLNGSFDNNRSKRSNLNVYD